MFKVAVFIPTLLLIWSITYGCALQVKIQSVKTCKFFDATEYVVELVDGKNSDVQKWELKAHGNATYVFKNVANGNVLDFQHGCATGKEMITFPDHNAENEWFYLGKDCTIRIACAPNLRLTVRNDVITLAEYNANDDNRFLLKVV